MNESIESPATVADVLRRAAQIHAERGGCKGRSMDEDGRVCLAGAVGVARIELRIPIGHSGPVNDAIMETAYRRFGIGPAVWNDLLTTTDLDVQKFLLHTADEVEFSS